MAIETVERGEARAAAEPAAKAVCGRMTPAEAPSATMLALPARNDRREISLAAS
jgi:hypothetical protein